MTATLTAYATTSDSMPGADAGITVFDADGTAVATETVTTELDGDWSHMLDEGAADALLADMGFNVESEWVESGGQWATTVTR